MTKRMLIDATHAEETRVVVLDGSRLEDFDVETSTKKQLKGNIYLAKVVRVEPSLQAAFVEYGGNRHGFLAFGEIHPDYYQIPVADRQRLLAMEAEDARREEEEEDREALAAGREENGSRDAESGADEHEARGYDEAGYDGPRQEPNGSDGTEPSDVEPGEIGDDAPDGPAAYRQSDAASQSAGAQAPGDELRRAMTLRRVMTLRRSPNCAGS